MPECCHWIDACGAARRNKGRQQSDRDQKDGRDCKSERVKRADARRSLCFQATPTRLVSARALSEDHSPSCDVRPSAPAQLSGLHLCRRGRDLRKRGYCIFCAGSAIWSLNSRVKVRHFTDVALAATEPFCFMVKPLPLKGIVLNCLCQSTVQLRYYS